MQVATCSAPTNIATIKYWGKDSEALNTPLNSSVSVTLHQDQLCAKTTIASKPSFTQTRLWLNGQEQPINKRVATVIREMKALAPDASWKHKHLHIVSENSFPTAAGLASSAAGYACLVATLAELFGIQDKFPGQLSTVARQGSGSACRSLDGGFVRWEKGVQHDGSDSRAIQIADEHHWPKLCAVVCVVNDKEKDTSSTNGMRDSKDTSVLLKYRAQHVVQDRLDKIEAAYKARDFPTFGKITMQDSNQFHATCLDTYPPIFYMNEVSRKIIHLIHQYNAQKGEITAAYTFDAGPNAVIFLEEQHVQEVVSMLLRAFPTTAAPMHMKSSLPVTHSTQLAADVADAIRWPAPTHDGVKMLYVSRVGDGVRVLAKKDALVDLVTGEPLRLAPAKSASASTPFSRTNAWLSVLAATAAVAALVAARR